MNLEQWATIPGYEGRYEASDAGRVRSMGFYSGNRWGTKTWRAGRVLRPAAVPPVGHLHVTLVDQDGRQRSVKVHRAVLLAFRGQPPVGRQFGLHGDDDPANNALCNLRWGTSSDNSHDAVANGGHTQSRKVTCGLGHVLTAPNLVPAATERGNRACLACHLTRTGFNHDRRLAEQGGTRTRRNRGRDGFRRMFGETFEREATRRYAHIMGHQAPGRA